MIEDHARGTSKIVRTLMSCHVQDQFLCFTALNAGSFAKIEDLLVLGSNEALIQGDIDKRKSRWASEHFPLLFPLSFKYWN